MKGLRSTVRYGGVSPLRGVSASRSFTVHVCIYLCGGSYATSMCCSCLNFIPSGFIGERLAKTDTVFLEKTT